MQVSPSLAIMSQWSCFLILGHRKSPWRSTSRYARLGERARVVTRVCAPREQWVGSAVAPVLQMYGSRATHRMQPVAIAIGNPAAAEDQSTRERVCTVCIVAPQLVTSMVCEMWVPTTSVSVSIDVKGISMPTAETAEIVRAVLSPSVLAVAWESLVGPVAPENALRRSVALRFLHVTRNSAHVHRFIAGTHAQRCA